MKTRTKRILLLSLCVALLVLCGTCAFAAKATTTVVDHVVYQLVPERNKIPQHYDVVCFFDSEDAMQGVKKVTIPAQINGIPVTTVHNEFSRARVSYVNSEVEEIVLPDTITNIGEYSFHNMKHLSKLDIPSSVTYLGRNAFLYCCGLESITIPESVKTIGPGCFKVCKNLKTVDIQGNGLKKIDYAAFGRCASLQYIDLPASLETIDGMAFFRSGLRLLRVPGGCTLESRALMNAYKLKKVVFENRTTDALPLNGFSIFANCERLLKVYLPKQAPKYQLYPDVFSGCSRLKAVYRTDSISAIWGNAFEGCDALTSLTIPAGVEKVNYNAFLNFTGIKKLRVLTTNASVFVDDAENGNCLETLPDTCKVYVKTANMKRAVVDAGCKNTVIVKADLK